MRFGNFAIFHDNVADADWAFMCRYDIRDGDGELYLRRYRLFQTPWFAIYLHKILMADTGRDLHDHPWNFISLVLKGGYWENTRLWGPLKNNVKPLHGREKWLHKRWSLYRRKGKDFHSISKVMGETWTLVLTGRRQREWGFLKDNVNWVHHNDYKGEK